MVISDSFVENIFSKYSGRQWKNDPVIYHTVSREEKILKTVKITFLLKL